MISGWVIWVSMIIGWVISEVIFFGVSMVRCFGISLLMIIEK